MECVRGIGRGVRGGANRPDLYQMGMRELASGNACTKQWAKGKGTKALLSSGAYFGWGGNFKHSCLCGFWFLFLSEEYFGWKPYEV